MNYIEIRSSLVLAAIFALRMLGLFLILPIFSIYAQGLPGGDRLAMVGWAMGIYGLVQACLHIPLGMLSDYLGRKPVIIGGLMLFVLGGIVAALSNSLEGIICGRAIQGAGAISAAITALVADLTRETHRSKAMAIIGASIGLSFALSLVIATPLYQLIGMSGIFWIMSILGCGAILLVIFGIPSLTITCQKISTTPLLDLRIILQRPDLWRFNFGVLVLHAVQVAMFIVVPRLLNTAGLSLPEHWKVYLPVILCSFVLMLPPMIAAERAGKTRLILLSAVSLLFLVQLMFAMQVLNGLTISGIALLLLLFFTGFNLLEAMQPALVSRLATQAKGTALGIYNTTQALGLFLGGALGGWILKVSSSHYVFLACAGLLFLWLIIARNMQQIPRRQSINTISGDTTLPNH